MWLEEIELNGDGVRGWVGRVRGGVGGEGRVEKGRAALEQRAWRSSSPPPLNATTVPLEIVGQPCTTYNKLNWFHKKSLGFAFLLVENLIPVAGVAEIGLTVTLYEEPFFLNLAETGLFLRLPVAVEGRSMR